MKYCVGLTGNIGSGKSTAAKMFSQLGINVINADKISRQITQPGTDAYEQIRTHFGDEAIQNDNTLNRSYLRELIFKNPSERKWMEELLHPIIRAKMKKMVDLSSSPYSIIEVPLRLEKNTYPYIQRILLITAPEEVQIARVRARDNCSVEQAKTILATQPPLEERINHADDYIENTISIAELRIKIKALHDMYLHLAREQSTE